MCAAGVMGMGVRASPSKQGRCRDYPVSAGLQQREGLHSHKPFVLAGPWLSNVLSASQRLGLKGVVKRGRCLPGPESQVGGAGWLLPLSCLSTPGSCLSLSPTPLASLAASPGSGGPQGWASACRSWCRGGQRLVRQRAGGEK